MRKPRVVFLDHVALLSGAELALLRLLPSLMKGPQAIEPYVLLGDDGPLVARLREEVIECEVIALNPRVGDLRKDTVGSRLPLRAVWGTAGYILRIAREIPSDLIVMGTHGRTGLSRLLMGSVAEQVLRQAPCPVLTVKTPFPETSPAPDVPDQEPVKV